MAGITYPDKSYHIRRPESNVSVIEYIISGEGYVIIEGETHPVTKDMIYFFPAGMNQEYFSDKDNPFTKIFMNIDNGVLCERLVSAFGLEGKYIFDGSGLKEIFERILITIHSDLNDADMQPVFHGLLVEIFSRLQKAEHMSAHSDEALRLKIYLDGNLNRIVTGKELSAVIFRSPDYCLKLFSREFGTTPYAYQLERKMQVARTLLADTHMTVGEIAEAVGYGDLHYFSNLFKEKIGVRPLEYRKNRQ
jgi:AraC-like DNA-binding protein